MKTKSNKALRIKDIDIMTYLRYKGFEHKDTPEEDAGGIRWIVFVDTPEIREAMVEFMMGNDEHRLLQEFRKTRSFILDASKVKAA